MQHQKAGELAKAESLYRHLLQRAPANADACFQLGSLLCQTDRLADGLPLLITAAKANPDNPQFQYYLGISLSIAGRLEESAAAHLKAVQLGPGVGVAHYALGNVLRKQGKWELAKASYEQSIALGFVPPELFSYLAEIELGMRNYRQAVEFSRQELQRNPNHTASRLQLAQALFALNDTETALAEYRKAVPSGGGVPAAVYPLMSAKEYSQAAGTEYLVVAPAKSFAVDAPKSIGWPFGASGGTATLEERYVARIRNGLLFAGHNVVLADDSHAIYDNLRHPLGETVVPIGEKFLQLCNRDKLLLDFSDTQISRAGRGVHFTSPSSRVYGHWFAEILPRLQTLNALPEFADVPLYVDAGLPPGHYRALELLTNGQRDIVRLLPGTCVKFDELLLVPSPTFFPYACHPDTPVMVEISPTSAEACEYLRDSLLGKLSLPVTPWAPGALGRRLYLGRRAAPGTRKLMNGPEIEQRYLSAGFEIIYPEDYTLDEQIRMFNSATDIAGPHGSAFVNIIFCRPGTRVSVFSQQHGANFAAWAAAVTAMGLEHLYVVGEAVVGSSWHIHHYDYEIPSALIDQSLEYHA
ncbi:MAG: DUF563 domain-containing protein [Betaproteobacteria bacterium]|nr:DUF563 domain-containing protein [Betaproteobacteria bacterium]